MRAQSRMPGGRTFFRRDRVATQAFPRAHGFKRSVFAGKISRSRHPLRSTRFTSARKRNSCWFNAVKQSSSCRFAASRAAVGQALTTRRRAPTERLPWPPWRRLARRKVKLATVHPHPMHDHGELSRQRHERALVSAFSAFLMPQAFTVLHFSEHPSIARVPPRARPRDLAVAGEKVKMLRSTHRGRLTTGVAV